MDFAFILTCKWMWSLSLYLDSFADNIVMDTICSYYCFIVAILIYVYEYLKSSSIQEMFATHEDPSFVT